jgi:hypothetical protein
VAWDDAETRHQKFTMNPPISQKFVADHQCVKAGYSEKFETTNEFAWIKF